MTLEKSPVTSQTIKLKKSKSSCYVYPLETGFYLVGRELWVFSLHSTENSLFPFYGKMDLKRGCLVKNISFLNPSGD